MLACCWILVPVTWFVVALNVNLHKKPLRNSAVTILLFGFVLNFI
jgi:hypothetical protein